MFWRLIFLMFATVVVVVLASGSSQTQDLRESVPATPMVEEPMVDEESLRLHLAEVEAWHARRLESLRRPEGWLSLVGLFALSEGRHRFGSAEDTDLRVPAGHPAHIGTLEVSGGRVTMTAAAGVDLLRAGEPVAVLEMQTDLDGDPTVLEAGDLVFHVIVRDERPYLRVKDRKSPLLQTFAGIERWPVRAAWRIEGRWVPYDEPRLVRVPNIIGTVDEVLVPAAVEFEIGGRLLRLDPTGINGSLFFVFGDATNGVSSYGAGRFLYADLPEADGRVVLDFNRSYNPPCVFTPFATCPLPPESNELDVAIEAGEKMWGELH